MLKEICQKLEFLQYAFFVQDIACAKLSGVT